MRSNLIARLRAIERYTLTQIQVLTGSYEVHCSGAAGHFEGEPCDQHEDCVFRSTPTHGSLRRQIIMAWKEGLEDPFTID